MPQFAFALPHPRLALCVVFSHHVANGLTVALLGLPLFLCTRLLQAIDNEPELAWRLVRCEACDSL